MFTFFPNILALKMAEIAIFMVMVMVMVIFMVIIIVLVMTNGFYNKFEDIYFLPHHFSTYIGWDSIFGHFGHNFAIFDFLAKIKTLLL